ncbi:hypothetical protein I4U23_003995 [Adineta vaga]|nr:hypothetical protein I4U23_003995 [Adineta vaga]
MGTFVGHLIPGSIFLILSVWWTYSAWLRYFICQQRQRSYYVSLSFPLHCCGSRIAKLPIEAIFIIISTSVGIITEISAGVYHVYDTNGRHIALHMGANSLQHVATYMVFFLVGIIDFLIHQRFPIPKHMDIVAVNLAFSAEAVSFYFHGHARSPVEIQLHVLLALAICGTVIGGIFEIIQHNNQIYATLMRAYFAFVQGSWFYTVGFFLYSPFHAEYSQNRDPDEHRTLMLITFYFVIHMVIGLSILVLLALPAYYVSKRKNQATGYDYVAVATDDDNDKEQMKKIYDLNGKAVIHSDTYLLE